MTIFIQKGDAPMSVRQAVKRGLRYFEAQKQQYLREAGLLTDDADYKAWAAQWLSDNAVNGANNQFNHQLAAYRAALARLAQYRSATGRAQVTESRNTGALDDSGNPVTETVVVQPAIAPLPAEIEQAIILPETGAHTGTEMVANPAIVQDEAERAAAQAVIDATPPEVKAF